MKKHFLRQVKIEDLNETNTKMAQVINMSMNSSYADLNGCALDLRKRDRESPDRLECAKKFKFYEQDDNQNHKPKLMSPVNSDGSLTPSPNSSFHAPIQWPLETARGYSSSPIHSEQTRATVSATSPNDLHAKYSEFFDYAKTKFSFSTMNRDPEVDYHTRRILSQSPSEMGLQFQRSSVSSMTSHKHSLMNLHVGVHHLGRSASVSPNVVQPESPVHERLMSPRQTSRPRSAENPSLHSPFNPYSFVDSSKVNRSEVVASAPRGTEDDRISPRSLPRADSSMSGKSSPLSQQSSLDASDSYSENLAVKSVARLNGSVDAINNTSSTDAGSKIESFPSWNGGGIYLDHVHPAISLTEKIITAGVTGKPTRPFKAYPKDPLFLATNLAVLDPEEYRYSQQDYYEFREKMLALTRNGSGLSNPKMKRSGSPTNGEIESQEGTKDAQYWERRRKNNEAAKRSRDARKAKEDEIAIRAAYLENQNQLLTAEITHLRIITDQLRRLAQQRLSAT